MKLNNKRLKSNTLFVLALAATQAFSSLPEQRQQELSHLLKHDCGSCHGMTLKGGLGPSLLPEALKEKPDELLFVTIREGRHGTPMPPWKTQLTEDEVHWIIQLLRKGPEE